MDAGKLEALAIDYLQRACEPGRLAGYAVEDAHHRLTQDGDPETLRLRLSAELRDLYTYELGQPLPQYGPRSARSAR